MADVLKKVNSINSELLSASPSLINMLVLRPSDPFNFNVREPAVYQKMFFAMLPQGFLTVLVVQSAKEAAKEIQSWLQSSNQPVEHINVFIHPQWVDLDPSELYGRIVVGAQAINRRPEITINFEGSARPASKWRFISEAQLAYVSLTQQRGNQINPETFVTWTRHLFQNLPSVNIRVLEADECQRLNMNAFLVMGRGAAVAPRVLVLEYVTNPNAPCIALVGKGVTFDTGGLNLKGEKDINEMYMDKAGAAVVVSTIYGLALKNAQVNVVAVAGLIENAVGPNSVRPDDIVISMSGKSIEIIDTDCEGRMLLADMLWYTGTKYKPAIMIDIATLTGSLMNTFKQYRASVFGTNSNILHQVVDIGEQTGDRLWPMPLISDIKVSSLFANLQNYNKNEPDGLYAARFLLEFIPPSVGAWIHIDFCGMAMDCEKIISPFGPHLMMQIVEELK